MHRANSASIVNTNGLVSTRSCCITRSKQIGCQSQLRDDEAQDLGEVTMGEAEDSVSPAVVDRDSVELVVDERCAREDDVRHVADLLVEDLRRQEVLAGPRDHLPRL